MLAAAVAGLALVRAGGHLTAPGGAQRHALVLAALWIVAGSALLVAIGRIPAGAAVAAALALVAAASGSLQNFNTILPPREAYPARRRRIAVLQRQPGPFHVGVIPPSPGSAPS